MEIGNEVVIIGKSRYRNGYEINSIGYIIDIEQQGDGIVYKVTTSISNKKFDWFGYTKENIKLSNLQKRENKLIQILND